MADNISELMLTGYLEVSEKKQKVVILVDTGCRIPFVFRKGLVDSSKLVKAKKPIAIRVADGKLMQGGSLGCMAAIHISVMGSSGHMTEVKCSPF